MSLVTWFRARWEKNLRRKLLISSITTLLFFLSLLGYLSFRVAQTVVRQEVNQRNIQLTTLVAQDINTQFDNIWGNVRLLMYQLDTASETLPLQARAMLELRRASPLTYRALYLLDDQGRVLLHLSDSLDQLLAIEDVQEILTRPSIPLTGRLEAAYQAARAGSIFISPVFIVGADQVPNLVMGIPMINRNGQTYQVVVAEIDLRDIWRSIDEIRLGQTGRAFVVSSDGVIIAHPDRAYIGRSLAASLNPVLKGYEGLAEYTDPLSGAVMLAAYSPVGRVSDWGVVVEQERAEALQPINVMAFITLGVSLIGLALATLVVVFTAQSITGPIQDLAAATQVLARTGDLSSDIRVEGRDEVAQLAVTFNQMIASLRDARDRLLAGQAIAQELRVARQIQLGLLPESSPLVVGLEVTATCLPAQEVGGDFYGYYHLQADRTKEDSFAVAVGDVSGKGTPAALYMAVSSSALAAKAQGTQDSGQLCNELNSLLYPRIKANRMNIALLYVHFTRHNAPCADLCWTAHIVNAGLIAPLLRREKSCQYLDVNGLPLGVIPETHYQQVRLPMQPGDWLILCSDGIVEAMNPHREMYGFDRLQERVLNAPALHAYDMINWILKDVKMFMEEAEPHDDMTVVVIRLKKD